MGRPRARRAGVTQTRKEAKAMATRTNGTYDLVLKGGRVIDPGRALDATMDVAVRDGKIAAVKGLDFPRARPSKR